MAKRRGARPIWPLVHRHPSARSGSPWAPIRGKSSIRAHRGGAPDAAFGLKPQVQKMLAAKKPAQSLRERGARHRFQKRCHRHAARIHAQKIAQRHACQPQAAMMGGNLFHQEHLLQGRGDAARVDVIAPGQMTGLAHRLPIGAHRLKLVEICGFGPAFALGYAIDEPNHACRAFLCGPCRIKGNWDADAGLAARPRLADAPYPLRLS